MENTSGFYKLDDILLYGPNFVINKDYELYKETKDDNVYPIDGWYWFDSEEDARLHFNLPAPEPQVEPQGFQPFL